MTLIIHNIKELHGILSADVNCLKGSQWLLLIISGMPFWLKKMV